MKIGECIAGSDEVRGLIPLGFLMHKKDTIGKPVVSFLLFEPTKGFSFRVQEKP